jgi:DNA-binding response OmpR family regulator
MVKNIIIVDDEEQIRTMLRLMLEREGYSIREAANGDIALKLYSEEPADLIITDIIMPDKEGLGTILEFKNNYPDVSIFAMSGGGRNSPDQYLHMAKSFGVKRVFRKPFSREELLKAIRELSD